jgi:hypothetical protein
MGGWWAPGSTTNNQDNLQAIKNSNSTIIILQNAIPTTSNAGLSMGGTKMVYMNGTTDYMSFTAFSANSGGQTLQVGSTATGQGTWCSMHLIAYGEGFTGPTGAASTVTGPTGPTGAGETGPTGFTGPTGGVNTKVQYVLESSSVVPIDWSQGPNGVLGDPPTARFMVDISNFPTTLDQLYELTIIIPQGSTDAWYADSMEINGSPVSLYSYLNDTIPTTTTNMIEIQYFKILYVDASTVFVFTKLESYGGFPPV